VALRQYLGALRQTCGGDNSKVAQRVIPVTRSDSRLGELAKALGCPEIFRVPEGVDEHLTIFSAVGLLPSAILGLNVVSLLEGAQVMTAHFRNAPPGQNRVLDYAAACHVAGRRLGRTRRVLNVWAKALESTGHWVEHLLSGSQTTGITAVTTLHTRDLYGRGQPLRLGREALVTDLIVEQWRCDPLRVGPADFDYDGLAPIADKTVPELTAAAIRATKDAYRAHGLLHVDLRLPQLNEFFVGQLMQLLMLAAAVEVRLTGIHSGGSFGVQCHLQSAFPPGDPI
jgi:glucose-6-phosphate isomerase